jgi:hypothetical protein
MQPAPGAPRTYGATVRALRPRLAKAWLATLVGVAIILILAKLESIARGPTGGEAITVIGVAERRMAEARWQVSGGRNSTVDEAGAALSRAWSDLDAKRYQESIRAAQAAAELLRDAWSADTRLTASER